MSVLVNHPDGAAPLALDEITRMVSQKGDPAETLTNIVRLLQTHFRSDVCSVYLIQPDRANLVLAATVGLRPESVGQVRMKLQEGLTGLVAEQLRPIVVEDAPLHPRFKYFPEAGEEAYHSFLGVPLVDQGVIQGVLVIQTIERRTFSRDERTGPANDWQQVVAFGRRRLAWLSTFLRLPNGIPAHDTFERVFDRPD
jgi:glycogen phosphorylase